MPQGISAKSSHATPGAEKMRIPSPTSPVSRHRSLTFLSLAFLLAACGSGSPLGPTPPESEAAGRLNRAAALTISPKQPTVRPGEQVRFLAQLRDASGNLIESDLGGGKVKWEATGGTISATGYYVAGSTEGAHGVKATTVGANGGLSDTTTVRIQSAADTTGAKTQPVATTISISPASAAMLTGDTMRFQAQVRDQKGTPMAAPIAWSATGGTIAGGVYVAGSQAGSYQATATSGSLAASAAVTISVPSPDDPTPPPDDPTAVATTISISPAVASLLVGDTVRFTATVRDQNGTPMTAPIAWSATGGTIAGGVYVAGSQAGSYKATATSGPLSASATVSISLPTSGSLNGVPVYPGQSIQAAVDAKPAGTTFVIKTGRHVRQTIEPKDGMTFVGEPGAILDGAGTALYAFDGSSRANRVTIRGLIIENYAPGSSQGAIRGANGGTWLSDSWVVEGCEVRYTRGGMGIKIGNRMVVRNNNLHHNDQYGVGGSGTDVLVEGNEIAYSNYRSTESVNSGGTKFSSTLRLVVRNNYVHHNYGPGLWTDINNTSVLVEGNQVEDNHQQGIFHEIGHSAVIRNNVVRRNGLVSQSGWLYDAGILIAHSDNVEVYGNTVEDNWNGIVGIQQDRGTHELRNLWVHDNTVTMSRGQTGVGLAGTGVYNPFNANNRFDRNDYRVDAGVIKPFKWEGSATWSEWRSVGQDVSGSLQQM